MLITDGLLSALDRDGLAIVPKKVTDRMLKTVAEQLDESGRKGFDISEWYERLVAAAQAEKE